MKNTGYIFYCNDLFHKTKQSKILGDLQDPIVQRTLVRNCLSCLEGKAWVIRQEAEKQLRRKKVAGLISLKEDLEKLRNLGGLAQIFLCKQPLFKEKKFLLSVDSQTLNCPLLDNAEVNIKEHCAIQEDPAHLDLEPPCRYLIDPEIFTTFRPSKESMAILKSIADEYDQRPESEPQPETKEVEAKVLDPEGP